MMIPPEGPEREVRRYLLLCKDAVNPNTPFNPLTKKINQGARTLAAAAITGGLLREFLLHSPDGVKTIAFGIVASAGLYVVEQLKLRK